MSRDRTSPADTERHIADLARGLGWLHHQARRPGVTAEGYADGFPPVALLRDQKLVLVTVLGRGRLTTAEQLWIEGLGDLKAVQAVVVVNGDLRQLRDTLRDGSSLDSATGVAS